MEDHKCQHEANIAIILERTEQIPEIYKILNGNGKEGLVTGQALLKQSLGRVWWWLGGISLAILGVAVKGIWH